MAAEETANVLKQFMELGSKEIDVIATRVKFEPAAQATVVQILQGLSAATNKATSDFANTVQNLPEQDRERLFSSLEKSGVINTMNLLIPLLRMGDATDPCFLAHEASKALYATANILSWYQDVLAASIIEGAALAFDIGSQTCAQAQNEQMQETIATMEQQIVLLDQKISYIMDLPAGGVIPVTPPDTQPVSLTALEKMLEVCKKFYKFEGSFTPTFEKDKRLIRIGPLVASSPPIPILVTGFIDLGGMQEHDVVTITTKVLEPSPVARYVIWRVKTYTGPQSSGMKHFQDFADLLEVPGDGVEVLIAQSASSHNFDRAFLLTIPYQFLIESTVEPAFVLT